MNRELLKAWVHHALQNPIDEHQLAHAEATKELLEENVRYREALEFYADERNYEFDHVCDSYSGAIGDAMIGTICAVGLSGDRCEPSNHIAREALKGE